MVKLSSPKTNVIINIRYNQNSKSRLSLVVRLRLKRSFVFRCWNNKQNSFCYYCYSCNMTVVALYKLSGEPVYTKETESLTPPKIISIRRPIFKFWNQRGIIPKCEGCDMD